jgi:hypothetical protein
MPFEINRSPTPPKVIRMGHAPEEINIEPGSLQDPNGPDMTKYYYPPGATQPEPIPEPASPAPVSPTTEDAQPDPALDDTRPTAVELPAEEAESEVRPALGRSARKERGAKKLNGD